ncbi:uncharacterized protein PG986_005912 [Apiospora aurea]|uniref:CxC5 like cysteine cluster associated with KDZ domain-containing protein n=1 Tax=Apiospora aurea TaxID=335848 RepID=A0ABR1QIX2_9PEZI
MAHQNQITQQQGPAPVAADLLRWMTSTTCPREIFDLIVGWLPLRDQAHLSLTDRALRAKVLPVMTGYVWQSPPAPLSAMLVDGRMRWGYVEQAESLAAAGTAFVGCPWCRDIHPPLAAIDGAFTGDYACRHVERSSYEPYNMRLVSLYERPLPWHPLVLHAFVRYSREGRRAALAALCAAAQLDSYQQVYTHLEADGSNTWKLVWQPGVGLFARSRVSETLSPDDKGGLTVPCCPCERNSKVLDFDDLRKENFAGAVFSEFQAGPPGVDDPVELPMLSDNDRRSPSLVVGPVRGCDQRCVDWQAAFVTTGGEQCLHWTTWFFLGQPECLAEVLDSLLEPSARHYPDKIPSLGIGNVARLSGLTEDY